MIHNEQRQMGLFLSSVITQNSSLSPAACDLYAKSPHVKLKKSYRTKAKFRTNNTETICKYLIFNSFYDGSY